MSVVTDWLEGVRAASARIEALRRDISALEYARDERLPWQTRGSGVSVASSGVHSDPTQRDAFAQEGLEERIVAARLQLDECVSVVGDCLRVLSWVRETLGEREADALEIYYVDCAATWSEVAWEMGVSRWTVARFRDEALGWLGERVADGLLRFT